MAIEIPPVIDAPPAVPQRNDRNTFANRVDAFITWQADSAVPQMSAVAANVAHNAAEALASAQAAEQSKQAANGTVEAAAEQVALAADHAEDSAASAVASEASHQAAMAVAAAFGDDAGLPSLAGNAGRALMVNSQGTDVEWRHADQIIRSASAANIVLTADDRGKLIDITSGTFAQTFAPAAALGSGWFCYIRNSGTGDITIDPSGAETIDGSTTLQLGPGARILVQCDGAALYTAQSQRAATGSSLTLLATLTPTAVANIDALSVFSAAYDSYRVIGQGLVPSGADNFAIRLASAGVVDSGLSYFRATSALSATEKSTPTDSFYVNEQGATVTANAGGISFVWDLLNMNSPTTIKSAIGCAAFMRSTTPGYCITNSGGVYPPAKAVSGLRFFWGAGANFLAAGKIRIYGYNNA